MSFTLNHADLIPARLLGGRLLHEPRSGRNIRGFEPLGPHEVDAYHGLIMP